MTGSPPKLLGLTRLNWIIAGVGLGLGFIIAVAFL